MPRKEDHLAKARHDEAFASSLPLNTTPYLDWVITALFYAALHYVEAYFATQKIHSADHRARDSAIRRDTKLRAIYVDYSELKNFSINARYYMTSFAPADITKSLRPHLEAIKKLVSLLL